MESLINSAQKLPVSRGKPCSNLRLGTMSDVHREIFEEIKAPPDDIRFKGELDLKVGCLFHTQSEHH